MRGKLLNLFAILTSLIGFLQWGTDNSMFLFQAEAEILSKLFSNPAGVIHPLTILPLTGQLLLAVTFFQKEPAKILTLIGISALAILLGLMFIIGLIGLNARIFFSTIPFFVTVFFVYRYHRKKAKNKTGQLI